ncbi:hypothetical protein GCM10007320_51310 [Pseudorhodoferax aquiterrae]|uniref:Uncharacterized protein n=1 Tax=Pseudorhodoferax aquiterrae TaxID=747304 RepID=A0ABQ3G9F3_9BURK|nr:hypothetical protein GCM10007320_51310 [Pseudorhodoferax aquiterrae]
MGDLAALAHQHHGAGQQAGIDVLLEHLVQLGQGGGIQTGHGRFLEVVRRVIALGWGGFGSENSVITIILVTDDPLLRCAIEGPVSSKVMARRSLRPDSSIPLTIRTPKGPP